jgi:hypothetical protein
MNDKDTINCAASEWKRCGGDADGFAVCWHRVLEKLREMEKEKC